MTIQLSGVVQAWGTPAFNDVLKRAIEQCDHAWLRLQQGLSAGSHVVDDHLSAMVIATSETSSTIRAKVGVFYASILAGCSCADDPTPVDELSEYCELMIEIEKVGAAATVSLAEEVSA
jgi:hypothetical protein